MKRRLTDEERATRRAAHDARAKERSLRRVAASQSFSAVEVHLLDGILKALMRGARPDAARHSAFGNLARKVAVMRERIAQRSKARGV